MFEVRCLEKSGEVMRKVTLLPRTVEAMLRAVDQLSVCPSFLPSSNPFGIFLNEANTFFCVDDVGMIAVLPWSEQVLHCHITFWDRRLRGREDLCRTLAEFVVAVGKKPLITGIPEDNAVTLAFARRAGFEESSRNNGVVILHFTNYRE